MRIALKYCGSCNPDVDLATVASQLARISEGSADCEIVPLSDEAVDVVLILCGCRRACVDKDDIGEGVKQLVVAGASVAGRPVPKKRLPVVLKKELSKIAAGLQDDRS